MFVQFATKVIRLRFKLQSKIRAIDLTVTVPSFLAKVFERVLMQYRYYDLTPSRREVKKLVRLTSRKEKPKSSLIAEIIKLVTTLN